MKTSPLGLVPLDQFPTLVLDPRLRFEWHSSFWGYLVRSDPWKIQGLVRDWNIIHLIFDGEIECQADEQTFGLAAGTMVWLPPGIRLNMSWARPFAFTEFRFRLWRGKQQLRFEEPVYLNSQIPVVDLWRILQRINDELLIPQEEQVLMLRTLLSQLIVRLLRGAKNRAPAAGSLNHAQRHWLREFARKNLQRRPSLEEMAKGVQLSPDYFSRVFRAAYGMAPSRWILQERMEAAGRLLHESTFNISEISDRLGYTDVALFSRQFRDVIGTTPSRFRAAHR